MARPKPLVQAQDGPVLVSPDEAPALPVLETRFTKAPGPRGCSRYMKRRIAEAMPAIATALIDRALRGSTAELKLVVQIAGLDRKQPPTDPAERKFGGRYFEDFLMDEWRKEKGHDPTDADPDDPEADELEFACPASARE